MLKALYDMIDRLDDGARLPTVREMMKTFRVSQASVQEVLNTLRDAGLVTSQVGRGTYVVKGGNRTVDRPVIADSRHNTQLDSLLILSNSSMNERCSLVQGHIVSEMSQIGCKVVQISYHHTDHLLEILSSIPKFDAVILQSHYENIPIRLLHLLRNKTRALAVDGHTVTGVDLDRLGTDWEEALELALRHLSGLGHQSIGLVSLGTMAQPILSVRRAFVRIGNWREPAFTLFQPILLNGVPHPTHSVDKPLEEELKILFDERGKLPFTAMITLGISDAAGIRNCLKRLGLEIPKDLSVYMLGHHDVPSEHFDAMTMAGSSHRDAARQLIETVRRRLSSPGLPPQIIYLDCKEVIRRSTSAPPHP